MCYGRMNKNIVYNKFKTAINNLKFYKKNPSINLFAIWIHVLYENRIQSITGYIFNFYYSLC